MKSHLRFAYQLTTLMDTKFTIFGIKFGIDPLLDILPWFGSAVGAFVSFYLFWIAYKLKVPSRIYMRMLWNVVVDFVLGAIPYIGIIFDLYFKSNKKNFTLLRSFVNPEILVGEIVDS